MKSLDIVQFAEGDNEASAWQSLVKAVNRAVVFDGTTFYRVIGVRDGTRRVPAKQDLLGVYSGYELRNSKNYEVELSIYNSEEPLKRRVASGPDRQDTSAERALVPEVEERYFSFLPKTIPIHFRYDKETIFLVPRGFDRNTYTRVSIGCSERADGTHLPAPEVDLILKLVQKDLWLWILGISLIIGLGLSLLGDLVTILKPATDPATGAALQPPLWSRIVPVVGQAITTLALPLVLWRLKRSG